MQKQLRTSHRQLFFLDETLVQCIHLGLPTNRQHTPKVSEKAPTAAAFLFSIEAMSVAVSWGSNIQEEKRVEATAWTKKNHQDALRIKYWAKKKQLENENRKRLQWILLDHFLLCRRCSSFGLHRCGLWWWRHGHLKGTRCAKRPNGLVAVGLSKLDPKIW